MKKLLTALALIAALSSFGGIVLHFNSSFATTESVQLCNERINATNDRITIRDLEAELRIIKSKMYDIEDRWEDKFVKEYDRHPESVRELLGFMTKEYRDTYRELEVEKFEVENKLKKLKDK